MPSMRARPLCPQAVFLPGRHDRYGEVSARFHEVFTATRPLVEGISLDEAFLDVTRRAAPVRRRRASIAAQIRAAIHDELGLDASVGVAATKFVAKLASEAAKPRRRRPASRPARGRGGRRRRRPSSTSSTRCRCRPCGAWARPRCARLERFGVPTVGDLAALPRATPSSAPSAPAAGRHLHDLAWARDPRPVEPDRAVKSVSHEETFAHDLFDRARRRARGRAPGRRGGEPPAPRRAGRPHGDAQGPLPRLRHHHPGRDRSPSRSTRASPSRRVATALLAGVDLVARRPAPRRRRLQPGTRRARAAQPRVGRGCGRRRARRRRAGGRADGWERATGAVDRIRARFGDAAVGPAAMIGPDGLRRRRSGQWGPGAPARQARGVPGVVRVCGFPGVAGRRGPRSRQGPRALRGRRSAGSRVSGVRGPPAPQSDSPAADEPTRCRGAAGVRR